MFQYRDMLPFAPAIFQEKLRRPEIDGLSRPRLKNRLSSPSAPTVGCVLGPPGSGKTTLLGQLAATGDAPLAWYCASGDDGSEASLVSHLALALGSALSDREIVRGGRTGRIDVLLGTLEGAQHRPLQLVVDDLHELAGSGAEQALARFIRLRPRSIHIALGSRRPPRAINVSRMLVSGELGQLNADDLRFRTWEVEELFRVVYRQPLSPETAAMLTRRTGGWVAGLQLFHLATRDLTRLELDRAVGELNGRSQLIRSYLTRNVLDGLDEDRRSFLIRTSTLGVLSGDLCDALLQTTGSAAVLQDLERQQFFTTSSDGGITYRYHYVLQTHLEVLLADELSAAEARELYTLSGGILEGAGHLSAALRAHARVGDWGSVARLLQQTSFALPSDEVTWPTGVERLGSDDPWITVANARRMFRCGRILDAVSGFRRAGSLLDDPDFRARCASERAVAEDWLPSAPAYPTASTDPRLRVSRGLRRATRSVLDVANSTGLVGGTARLLSGDTVGASAELRSALAEPGLAVWEKLAIRLVAQLVELDRPAASAAGLIEEIVLAADLDGLPWLSRVARGLQYVVLGASHPGTPSWLDSGRDLIEECQRQDDRWASCVLGLAIGTACLFGDDPAGDQILNTAGVTAGELDAPVLQMWATSLRAAGAVQRHDPGASENAEAAKARAATLGVDIDHLLSMSATAEQTRRPPVQLTGQCPPNRLTCLGSFEMLADGREVPWRGLRPRAQTLLMFLAMRHGHEVHRETLIDALWPATRLSSGIRSLQVAVSSVRQCLFAAGLPEQSLQRRWESYAMCLPDAVVQLDEVERLARRAVELERAGDLADALQGQLNVLKLYTGDLLPEVGPADWVVQERDRLRGVAAGAGADAARLALGLGDLMVGVRAAQRSIELDPYHDLPWELLVEGWERMGDHSAAAVARREHSRASAELGL